MNYMSKFKAQQKRPAASGYRLTTLALTPTDIRHRGGMSKKTPLPTELQIPATVTTLGGILFCSFS